MAACVLLAMAPTIFGKKHWSELARTRRVEHKPTLLETIDLVDLTSLNPDDDINSSDRIHNISEKTS